ncbi:MAG: PcfK-like family protein [Acetatifactor sp.]|nr:PcfK-like family protein [Acetatifactor sp.]
MEEADALPVGPEQIVETGDPELYQDMVSEMEENDSGQAELPKVEDDMAQTEIPETEDDSEQEETLEMEETEQAAEPETAEAESAVSGEDDEETERLKHEEAEAKRKAEWEEKQQAKKAAEQEKLDQIAGMSDDAAVSEAMKRVGADTEKLTRRNMKDCVAEYIQTRCLEDTGFARMVMHPRKNMINCFHYINRKAKDFIQQEMEDNDIRPENGVYGSDVPDDLCYQWAEDYFRDPDAKEDQGEEEKFVPRPYAGKGSFKAKTKKTADKKAAAKKPAGKKAEKSKQETAGQMSFIGQMSLGDLAAQEVKAG